MKFELNHEAVEQAREMLQNYAAEHGDDLDQEMRDRIALWLQKKLDEAMLHGDRPALSNPLLKPFKPSITFSEHWDSDTVWLGYRVPYFVYGLWSGDK